MCLYFERKIAMLDMAGNATGQWTFAVGREMGFTHAHRVCCRAVNGMAACAAVIADLGGAKLFAQMLRVTINTLQRVQRSPTFPHQRLRHRCGAVGGDERFLVGVALPAAVIGDTLKRCVAHPAKVAPLRHRCGLPLKSSAVVHQ
ncbi:hypothetical protein HRbin17_01805 [bacterium HR17]|jgi:hypothetical protein|uniref:Uncharacterized protein n=1 Tax=Candidatus Fervidibacter japonicus TaxID=2035412 RepID=A0A2H5XDL5_9BACT|nr:hypothetical protein HRbin17_01805 [bacterium HR17]